MSHLNYSKGINLLSLDVRVSASAILITSGMIKGNTHQERAVAMPIGSFVLV